MDDLRQILNQNWIGTLIGFVGILIGVIVAYLLRPRSRLATQVNTIQIAGPNSVLPDAIEFLFRGEKVTTVTMSRVAIWNVGNTTLNGDQIVNSDHLRIITAEGSNILEAVILNRTREVNSVTCRVLDEKPNEADFTFDYLDPGDGALVQLIHTGTEKVTVAGTLRGVRKPILIVGVTRDEKGREQVPTYDVTAKILPVALLVIGLIVGTAGILNPTITARERKGLFLLASLLMVLSPITMWFASRWPPSELGTQITSNLSAEPFWRRLFRKYSG